MRSVATLCTLLALLPPARVVLAQDTRTTSSLTRSPVTAVAIQSGKLMLQIGGRWQPIPSGVFTNADGVRLQISSSAVREIAGPAGAQLTQFASTNTQKALPESDASRTGSDDYQPRVLASFTRFPVQSTALYRDGSLHFRSNTGEVFRASDGSFRGEGTASGYVITFLYGKPVALTTVRGG